MIAILTLGFAVFAYLTILTEISQKKTIQLGRNYGGIWFEYVQNH